MARQLLRASDEAASIPIQRTSRATTDAQRVRASLVTPILLLFLLGTLDVLLTLLGLQHGGHELNPYARLVLRGGFAAFVTARVATFAIASLLILWLAPSAPRAARGCLAAATLVFLLVDLFSLTQLVIA